MEKDPSKAQTSQKICIFAGAREDGLLRFRGPGTCDCVAVVGKSKHESLSAAASEFRQLLQIPPHPTLAHSKPSALEAQDCDVGLRGRRGPDYADLAWHQLLLYWRSHSAG